MGLWDRVQSRMTALQIKTQKELAAAVKAAGGSLSQPQISGLKNGTVHNPRSLIALAVALQTTAEWLTENDNLQSAGTTRKPFHETESAPTHSASPIVTSPKPLIEWLSADGIGRAGEILIFKRQAGLQRRPIDLEDSQEAFAVRMRFSDMSPKYEPGDVLLIHPEAPVILGKDYLFVRNQTKSPFNGLVRRLVRESAGFWVVRAFGEDGPDAKLSTTQWTPWFIFGSYNR